MATKAPPSTIAQVKDVFTKLGEISDKVVFDNGVTKEEIIEIITHLSFYAGWPNGGTAALIAKEVFKERGV
jgi:hypothetical protein